MLIKLLEFHTSRRWSATISGRYMQFSYNIGDKKINLFSLIQYIQCLTVTFKNPSAARNLDSELSCIKYNHCMVIKENVLRVPVEYFNSTII